MNYVVSNKRDANRLANQAIGMLRLWSVSKPTTQDLAKTHLRCIMKATLAWYDSPEVRLAGSIRPAMIRAIETLKHSKPNPIRLLVSFMRVEQETR